MQQFTDMHGRPICDGAEIYYNGRFPNEIPTTHHIRNGIAIIDGDILVFAVIINNKLQGTGLYWNFDNEPCYDLIMTEEVEIFEPTIIKYRGITAEISVCGQGYQCIVSDVHDNNISWLIHADTMDDAINKATRRFDNAIRCLRGLITQTDFIRIAERD